VQQTQKHDKNIKGLSEPIKGPNGTDEHNVC